MSNNLVLLNDPEWIAACDAGLKQREQPAAEASDVSSKASDWVERTFARVNLDKYSTRQADELAREFRFIATRVIQLCPKGRERDRAVRLLEESFIWAVRSIEVVQ